LIQQCFLALRQVLAVAVADLVIQALAELEELGAGALATARVMPPMALPIRAAVAVVLAAVLTP
jgi:hypothetical protein